MAQIKTSELTGAALDWAVAKCEGILKDATQARNFLELCKQRSGVVLTHGRTYTPSTDWAQCGPIIEKAKIAISFYPIDNGINSPDWGAWRYSHSHHAHTPLIAAMRCYVASKLGDTVEVPDALIK